MVDLPEPYADEAAAWTVPPSARAPGGQRWTEAKQAAERLYTRDEYDALDPEERRNLLLLHAAGADTVELQSKLTSAYRSRLVNRAAGAGLMLWLHDREHTSARGRFGPDDPRWTAIPESRRAYVRQEWAARPEGDCLRD